MITELVVAGITTYCYQKIHYNITHKGEKELTKKWNKIMVAAGVKNKNDISNTFNINKITKTKYGYNCQVDIPDGLSSEKLESIKETLQDNLKCLCEFDKDRFTNYTNMKIITNPLNNLTFKPVKTKPYEILLGYRVDASPVLLNLNKFSHLLVAGVVGTGKSRLGFTILTNLIHNHTNKEIELYLSQIKKNDYRHFKNCNQVKMYCNKIADVKLMMIHLDEMIDRRTKMLDKLDAENISEYNQTAKIKIKYAYIFVEEFSFFMPDTSDNEIISELKSSILFHLKNIILAGRSVGINVITTVQRTTVDCLPSTIKSQMSRITFRQNSTINSTNIIENADAVGLLPQECILFTNDYTRIKTPYIDKQIIKSYIKDTDNLNAKSQLHYEWHRVTKEELAKMKDITVHKTTTNTKASIKENITKSIQNVKKRKNGVINLKDVKKDADEKR